MIANVGGKRLQDGIGATNLTYCPEQDVSSRVLFRPALERFWNIAVRWPGATAIVSGEKRYTFGDLLSRASSLASVFRATLNGRRESPISICTDDTSHLVIGALAAWQVGCAYLPISPGSPPERLRHMLEEAGVLAAVTSSAAAGLPRGNWKEIGIEVFATGPITTPGPDTLKNPSHLLSPDDAAYVIFTSGSAGRPKGVAVTQANLSNLLDWHQDAFKISKGDRGTQISPLSFDAAVLEIWPLLTQGATLYVPSRATVIAPEHLRNYLVNEKITVAFAVTAIAEQLLALEWPQDSALRFLLTGADMLCSFPRPNLPFQLVNNYGPTECTVLATSGVVSARQPEDSVPSIGAPIPGAEIYILDRYRRPVPDGECGEICISGKGVAAGYVGRADLTAERFIMLPSVSAGRVYLTGDLGKRLPNGEIQFLGRFDDQIKIRGYRIELGEIVAALRKHPAIATAFVTAEERESDKRLIAFVVLNSKLTPSEIRTHLAADLPEYMIPSEFIELAQLPLTPNGKIDRNALLASIKQNATANVSLADSETDLKLRLTGIFERVLGVSHITSSDDFFSLGGHSLLCIRLFSEIEKAFGKQLPLSTIFEAPTVDQLAEVLAGQQSFESVSLVAIQPNGALPPFFCVHPNGEDLFGYRELAAELGPNQPFFALQPRAVDGQSEPQTCVEDIAAEYIEQIRQVAPKGPYYLGGFCFGGIVAFEMAQQLVRQGYDVAALALIDTSFPGGKPRTLLRVIDEHWGEFLFCPPAKRLSYGFNLIRSVAARTAETSSRWARGFTRKDAAPSVASKIEWANIRAQHLYTPKPYPGPVSFYSCKDSPVRVYNDNRLNWSAVAEGGLRLHVVSGNHEAMLEKPHVAGLAAELGKCLYGLQNKLALRSRD